MEFEKAFGELAYAELREKAPVLLDHLSGFQVIDKNDESTRGVGVAAFEVADQLLYAPMFFDGRLKGGELLYLKNQDMFVPLQENWVNYIINRKPQQLGEVWNPSKDEEELPEPDLQPFSELPQDSYEKISCDTCGCEDDEDDKKEKDEDEDEDDGNLDGMTNTANASKMAFAKMLKSPTDAKYARLRTLKEFLKDAGANAVIMLAQGMKANIKFAEDVLRFYSIEDLSGSVDERCLLEPKEASETVKKKEKDEKDKQSITGNAPDVKIYTSIEESIDEGKDLTTGDKQRLLKGEIVIKDHRPKDKTSLVYNFEVDKKVTNPDTTGFYDVLTGDLKFTKLLVILFPRDIKGDRLHEALLIDTKTKKTFEAPIKKILVNHCYADTELSDWKDKLPTHRTMKVNNRYILFDKDGKCTAPFEIDQIITNDNAITSYKVWCPCGGYGCVPCCGDSGGPNRFVGQSFEDSLLGVDQDFDTVVVTKKDGGKFVHSGRTLFVPQDTKVYKLNSRKSKYDAPEPYEDPKELPEKLQPGTIDNFYAGAINSGAIKLSMAVDGTRITMVENQGTSKTYNNLTKTSALKYLVENLDVRGDEAVDMLGKVKPRHYTRYLIVKQAAPMAPAFPNMPTSYDSQIGANTNSPFEAQVDAQMPTPQPFSPDTPMDPSMAMQGAQTGQKEVLDTAMLGTLANAMDVPSIIDDYLGDIMLGMDRVGRILFLLYWKPDVLAERYGREDIIQLEDNLKNVFKSLGDIVLVLKQKSISPEPAFDQVTAQLPETGI